MFVKPRLPLPVTAVMHICKNKQEKKNLTEIEIYCLPADDSV
jgi:hypothetical protein